MTWRGLGCKKVNQQIDTDNRKEYGKVGQSENVKRLVLLWYDMSMYPLTIVYLLP